MKNLLPIDELNRLSDVVKESSFQEDENGKRKWRYRYDADEFINMIEDFLLLSISLGSESAMRDLKQETRLLAEEATEILYAPCTGDGVVWDERIRNHINDGVSPEEIIRVAETEMLRTFNVSGLETVNKLALLNNVRTVMKRWTATMDERTRETHWLLNGTEIPISEKFYSVDGDSANAPGLFEFPENNVNCRCILRFRYKNA